MNSILGQTRIAVLIGLLLAGLVVLRASDFAHRVVDPDFVALAFGEGGDDAYYFFTVARNIAQGKGITVDGVHWTTGFQPLWAAICALAFVAGDRAAIGLLYILSFALWLFGVWFLLRFVRSAHDSKLSPLSAAVIAAIFMCEGQFAQHYFNGMETGLTITVALGLLLAFQHHLRGGDASDQRLVGLGVLMGVTMLARNDSAFLCGALLLATLAVRPTARPLRDVLIIGAIASLILIPWLIYCQQVTGLPIPQSGVATSASLRGNTDWQELPTKVAYSLVPLVIAKLRTLASTHPPLMIGLAIAGALVLARVPRQPSVTVDRATRAILICLAAAAAVLLFYYSVFGSAVQFLERYLWPLKLLVLIGLSLWINRLLTARPSPLAAGALVIVATAAIATSAWWTWRDYREPYRGYIGDSAYEIVRSPLASGRGLMGFAESGRLGFLYPDRVINLDGKMRVDALKALRDGSFKTFLQSLGLEFIVLHDFDVAFFDQVAPGWKDGYAPAGKLATDFYIFARKR